MPRLGRLREKGRLVSWWIHPWQGVVHRMRLYSASMPGSCASRRPERRPTTSRTVAPGSMWRVRPRSSTLSYALRTTREVPGHVQAAGGLVDVAHVCPGRRPCLCVEDNPRGGRPCPGRRRPVDVARTPLSALVASGGGEKREAGEGRGHRRLWER